MQLPGDAGFPSAMQFHAEAVVFLYISVLD